MKLTALRDVITSKAGRQILLAQKKSPTVMVVAGAVGFVTTIVLASKATLKLDSIVDHAQTQISMATDLHDQDRDDYNDTDFRKDMVLIYLKTAGKIAKIYGPALVIGTTSLACFIGSHRIMSSRNAGLMAAYAALDKGFREYRSRVLEEVGEDKEREFRYGAVKKEILEETDTGPQTKTVARVAPGKPSIYARFFDEGNVNWVGNPSYNRVFLQSNQNYMNDMLRARGHVFLNDVYDALGFERTSAGSVVGWVLGKGGDDYIDFGIFDGNRPAIRDFVNGFEGSILLDFNVDGIMYDKI